MSVSELALGGLFVASWAAVRSTATATIRRALELGVNYIDTAPGYGDSEAVIGQALKAIKRDGPFSSLILSTKVGGRPQPFLPQDPGCLRASIMESLRLLRRDTLDLLMIHEPDRPGQYNWWTDPVNVQGPVLDMLQEMKSEGLIRWIGLGGTTVYEMVRLIRTGQFDVVLTAFNYSLLWREAEEVLAAAQEQKMGIIVGSPLQQGALARRYDHEIRDGAAWLSPPRRAQYRALYALLDELRMPLPELGLRFVLSNPAVSCVLMGARTPEEVEKNVAAVEPGGLSPGVLQRVNEIAAMVPYRPYEEPFVMPFGQDYHGPGPA